MPITNATSTKKTAITANKLKNLSLETNAEQVLEGLLSRNYKVELCLSSFEGKATKRGESFEFSIGQENLYFTIKGKTKFAVDETLTAIDTLHSTVINFD